MANGNNPVDMNGNPVPQPPYSTPLMPKQRPQLRNTESGSRHTQELAAIKNIQDIGSSLNSLLEVLSESSKQQKDLLAGLNGMTSGVQEILKGLKSNSDEMQKQHAIQQEVIKAEKERKELEADRAKREKEATEAAQKAVDFKRATVSEQLKLLEAEKLSLEYDMKKAESIKDETERAQKIAEIKADNPNIDDLLGTKNEGGEE